MINYNPMLADIARRIRAALPDDFAAIEVHTEIDAPQGGAENIILVTMATMTELDIGRPAQSRKNYTMQCNVGIALALNPADYPSGYSAVLEKQAFFSDVLHQVAQQLTPSSSPAGCYYYDAALDPTTQAAEAQSYVATYNIILTAQL